MKTLILIVITIFFIINFSSSVIITTIHAAFLKPGETAPVVTFPLKLLDAIHDSSSPFVENSKAGKLLHDIDNSNHQQQEREQEGKSANGKNQFCFISHGCWGGSDFGKVTHRQVAKLIAEKTKELDAKFVLTAGDNFYTKGIKSVTDKRFNDTFAIPYVRDHIDIMKDVPFVVALGNHDARGNIFAQVNMTFGKVGDPNWFFPYTYYSLIFRRAVSLAVVVLDCPLFERCAVNPPGSARCWDKDYQRQFLEQSLKYIDEQEVTHRIVMCHYPLYANGPHINHKFLRDIIDPMMEKYKVTMYINADNHYMQVSKNKKNGIFYVNSGGGGGYRLHTKKDKGYKKNENNVFEFLGNGVFTHCISSDDKEQQDSTRTTSNTMKTTAFGIKNGLKGWKEISSSKMFEFETEGVASPRSSKNNKHKDGHDVEMNTQQDRGKNENNKKLKPPPFDGGGEDFERIRAEKALRELGEEKDGDEEVEKINNKNNKKQQKRSSRSAASSSTTSSSSSRFMSQTDLDCTVYYVSGMIVLVLIIYFVKLSSSSSSSTLLAGTRWSSSLPKKINKL